MKSILADSYKGLLSETEKPIQHRIRPFEIMLPVKMQLVVSQIQIYILYRNIAKHIITFNYLP